MAVIEYVISGAKIRSAWANTVVTQVNANTTAIANNAAAIAASNATIAANVVTANARYVDVAGDTMTGTLSGTSIALSGTLTAVSIGLSGSEILRATNAGGYIAFWNGGTREGYLQGNSGGLVLSSETGPMVIYGSGGINLGNVLNANAGITVPGASLYAFASYGGAIWMQDGTFIRMNRALYSSSLIAADDGISVNQSGVTSIASVVFAVAINGSLATNAQIRAYRNGGLSGIGATSSNYYDATFYAATADLVGASTASISFHPSGVAPQLRVGASDAQIYNRASDGATNNPFTASAFNVASSRRIKKNITTWPLRSGGAAVEAATEVLARLNVVTFERDEPGVHKEVPSGRRGVAYQRLNNLHLSKGRDPYELPDHDCAVHDCTGTKDDPCARHLNHSHPEYGLIAEELHEILPEAVTLDADKKPASINYSMVDAVMIAAVQELNDRVKELEASR